jgi:hypothetical protein
MKLLSNNLLETLSNTEIKNLTTQVNETLLSNYKREIPKTFSSADLWNIHRQRRNFSARRNSI